MGSLYFGPVIPWCVPIIPGVFLLSLGVALLSLVALRLRWVPGLQLGPKSLSFPWVGPMDQASKVQTQSQAFWSKLQTWNPPETKGHKG